MEQPGRRLGWRGGALALGLWGLAVALRWPFLGSQPYGDEAVHFFTAKHLLWLPGNFSDVFGQTWFHPSYVLYQRPLYYLAFHAAASASFEAFRIQGVLIGSLLPVVAFGLLRQRGARLLPAVACGVAVAALPYFAVWGTFGLMDTPMAVLLLAALWARAAGRPIASALLFLAAVWTKETAYVAVAALWACTHVARWRKGEAPLWPLRMDAGQSALAVVLAIGLFPLMVALSHGLATPGGAAVGPTTYVAEEAFWSSWLVPVLAAGLWWPASRVAAAWGLGAGLFFVLLHGLLGRGVAIWYNVPSVALVLVGAFATLDAAWTALPKRRWVPAVGAFAVAGLLLAGGLVPDGPAKSAGLHPLHSVPSGSYADALDYELRVRDRDLVELRAWVAEREFSTLLAFDVEYLHTLYPFVDQYPRVLLGTSLLFHVLPHPVGVVADAIGANGTLTILQVQDTDYNRAVREVFADCVEERNPTYLVLRGGCAGRAGLLESRVAYPRATG